jgi:hypothetical protein
MGMGCFSFWRFTMKKLLIIIFLIIASLTFQVTVNAEEVDTDIHLDIQTILEKEYENKGITGLYDIEMFQENESPFMTYKNNKEEHYENLKNVLFVENSFSTEESDKMTDLQENGLFTKVNYHKEGQKSDSKDNGFSIFELTVFAGFVAVGLIASFIYIHIRKNKEVKNVYHYHNENK